MQLPRIIQQRLDLLEQLVRTNFKLRYNDSFLGVVWVILKPLLSFLVLFFVFSNFKSDLFEDPSLFQVYLLTGIVLYGYLSESLLNGMNSLLGLAHIILKVNFPKKTALISNQVLSFINFLITFAILLVVAIFSGIEFELVSASYMVLIVLTLTIMCYSISLFLSIMTVRLRDLKNIMEILLQLGFYLSPIFYPVSLVPEQYLTIYNLNPVTIMIQAFRDALILNQVNAIFEISMILAASIFATMIGNAYFKKHVRLVAEYY